MLDASFDAAGKEQRLRDFLNRLQDVVPGVAIAAGQEKLRGFSVLRRELDQPASVIHLQRMT